MIKSLNFSMLAPNQLFSLSEGAISLFQSATLPDGPTAAFLNKLVRDHDHYSTAFQRDNKNPYTEQKDQKDSERDEAFFAFRGFAEACTHRRDPAIAEPARKIHEVIRRYGWSSWSEGYQKQSSIFINMLEDLKENSAEEMAAIGAEPWFNELEEAQTAFAGVRIESVSNIVDSVTLSATRTPLENSIRNLFSMTELLAQTEESETFNQLMRDLNELITQTMSVARAAQTRRVNSKLVDEDQN